MANPRQPPPAASRDPLAAMRAGAIKLHQAGKAAQAIALYRDYLRQRPGDVGIWCNLGVAHRERKQLAVAEACYRRALELSPGDPAAMGNLGNVLKDLDRLDEAIALHERVVAASPDDERARHNYAIALREAARYAEAADQFDRLVTAQPGNATYRWDRALVLLHLGRSAQGWADYEARRETGDVKPRPYKAPEWNGEPLAGRTLYVHPEQGFGDTLMALRFLPQLKAAGATVVLECKPPLRRLLEGVAGADRLVAPEDRFADFDYHCSLMGIPRLVGADCAAPPPPATLTIPSAATARVAPLVAPGGSRFKVGVVWSGSVTFKGNAKRAVTVDRFLPFAAVPGVQLYSLQKGPREGDLAESGADSLMIDIGTKVEDFAESAAAIAALDLVIMTDSSVAHLCGSLGKPVWNLLPYHPYWIYPVDGDRTPWYPSMRLFRQQTPGDWDAVFDRARKALAAVVDERDRPAERG
ncbi:MAG: tetratricopeptide repeat protein [Alphaproteobacteria bacterium]